MKILCRRFLKYTFEMATKKDITKRNIPFWLYIYAQFIYILLSVVYFGDHFLVLVSFREDNIADLTTEGGNDIVVGLNA